MSDFQGATIPVWGPGTRLVPISPSDATDLSGDEIRALWVGGAGNVAVLAWHDSAPVTLVGVPAGTLLPLLVKKVMLTGTTATNIVGVG